MASAIGWALLPGITLPAFTNSSAGDLTAGWRVSLPSAIAHLPFVSRPGQSNPSLLKIISIGGIWISGFGSVLAVGLTRQIPLSCWRSSCGFEQEQVTSPTTAKDSTDAFMDTLSYAEPVRENSRAPN